MTKKLTDKDMLLSAYQAMEKAQCEFFACPGPYKRPVAMASCWPHSEAYRLRQYLKRRYGYKEDRYGRIWNLPDNELCSECGQPDNCGDCNHFELTSYDVSKLGGY